MRARLPVLCVIMIAVFFLTYPSRVSAGMGILGRKGDSFQTKEVELKGFNVGKAASLPSGKYSFKILGLGKVGVVEVRILDAKGKEVGKTTGHFGGRCPGKPTPATFAELGYSKTSPVKTAVIEKATRVTVECEGGSRIEFTLDTPVN
jgi:hypothetical protein